MRATLALAVLVSGCSLYVDGAGLQTALDDDAGATDGGRDAGVDAGSTRTIPCGSAGLCIVGVEACCRSFSNGAAKCQPVGSCDRDAGLTQLACDDWNDCRALSTSVCCSTGDENRAVSSCRAFSPSACERLLCDPTAPTPCPGDAGCGSSTDVPGYFRCR